VIRADDVKPSQLAYFSAAAESLALVQGEIEELTVAAEAEYRSDFIVISLLPV
jgi:hypothetical protein